MNKCLNVYINNIDVRKNNKGGWVELPYYSQEDLHERLEELGVDTDREYMVYDIDNYIGLDTSEFEGYYIDLKGLNETMLELERLSDNETEDFLILSKNYTPAESLQLIKSGDYHIIKNINSKYDLSYKLADIYLQVDEHIKGYLNHDSIIKDYTEEYNEIKGYAIVYTNL